MIRASLIALFVGLNFLSTSASAGDLTLNRIAERVRQHVYAEVPRWRDVLNVDYLIVTDPLEPHSELSGRNWFDAFSSWRNPPCSGSFKFHLISNLSGYFHFRPSPQRSWIAAIVPDPWALHEANMSRFARYGFSQAGFSPACYGTGARAASLTAHEFLHVHYKKHDSTMRAAEQRVAARVAADSVLQSLIAEHDAVRFAGFPCAEYDKIVMNINREYCK